VDDDEQTRTNIHAIKGITFLAQRLLQSRTLHSECYVSVMLFYNPTIKFEIIQELLNLTTAQIVVGFSILLEQN
jgi:hypothetical protein